MGQLDCCGSFHLKKSKVLGVLDTQKWTASFLIILFLIHALCPQISRTSLPEEGEFEMDLEVGGQPTSSSGRLPAPAGGGEFEMDLELDTSPPKLLTRDQFI